MRAIQATRYGGPEVLESADLPTPVPGSGQLLIRVHASNVNFSDIQTRQGNYAHDSGPPYVPGLEVTGTVAAEAPGFPLGQRVTAFTTGGSYSEYALANAALTYPLPDDISFEHVSGLTAAVTAINVLDRMGRLQAGETVLIHAAAGGVGSLAVQVARAMGAGRIIGTVGSEAKMAYAASLGATDVINYRTEDFSARVMELTDGKGADLILDSVAGETFSRSVSCLADFGRIVVFGQSGGEPGTVDTTRLFKTNRSVLGYSSGHRRRHRPEELRPVVERFLDLLRSGSVRVDIGASFPLEQAADAHRLVESRSSTGKVLLQVHGSNPVQDAPRKDRK